VWPQKQTSPPWFPVRHDGEQNSSSRVTEQVQIEWAHSIEFSFEDQTEVPAGLWSETGSKTT